MQKPVVEPPQERRTGSNLVDQGRDSSAPDLPTTGRDGLGDVVSPGATMKDCGVVVDRPAGEKPGTDPVDRSCGERGNRLRVASLPASQAGSGKARRLLMARGRGGGSVVVRGRESRPHGEGTQRVRDGGTGMSGGRR